MSTKLSALKKRKRQTIPLGEIDWIFIKPGEEAIFREHLHAVCDLDEYLDVNERDIEPMKRVIYSVKLSDDEITEDYMRNGGCYLLAYHKKKPLGFIGMKDMEYKDSVAISSVAVYPEYQGQGIASELMNRVIEFVKKERKCNNLFLGVYGKNEAAIKLYKKHGFDVYSYYMRAKI